MGSILPAILTATVLALPASAQVRRPEAMQAHPGTIEGQVRDSSGTPLSNFSVVAREQKSGNPAGTITSESGAFRIEGLASGTYDLIVARGGFSEARVANVTVDPDGRKSVNIEVPVRNTPE